MVIVFDLDDTLYEELTFVKSGFHAVSDFLASILNMSPHEIFSQLMVEFAIQRKHVFDRFLSKTGKKSSHLINHCLSVYRKHTPQIQLYPAASHCLRLLSNFPLYVVTDGNRLVQKRKCLALGLHNYVKKCFFTYSYGLKHAKPSPFCFQKICSIEQVPSRQVVYVGDNPYKDFVGIKPLGFHTIRVLTGPYSKMKLPPAFEAELRIADLSELTVALINKCLG
jgi:putative hydrolase of the HAD superfamily